MTTQLQHISSPFPSDGHAGVRRFYGTSVGLTEIPVPRTLDRSRFIWFSAGGNSLELHFFVGAPTRHTPAISA